MVEVKTLPEFNKWLSTLKNTKAQARLVRRLEKVEAGILGDVKYLQDNVWEMREFFDGGWRMYYTKCDEVIIIMLGGGDKSTQRKDIRKVVELAKLIGVKND